MTTIILGILALTLVQFVYEGIIAPSRRMALRFQVFEQRDRLRELKRIHGEKIDRETFECIEQLVTYAVDLVSTITLTGLVTVRLECNRDSELEKSIERRLRLVQQCKLDDAKDIILKIDRTVKTALTVNSFGLFLWLFPVVIGLKCIGWVKRSVDRLLLAPSREMQRWFPTSHHEPTV